MNKKALGIDYGTKYIGLAIASGDTVAPLEILENKFGHYIGELAIQRISKIIREENIEIIITGLPLLNGEETKAVRDIRVFIHKLKKTIPSNIVIRFADESYSSKIAVSNAIKLNVSKKRRKDDHALAACEILKRGLGIV